MSSLGGHVKTTRLKKVREVGWREEDSACINAFLPVPPYRLKNNVHTLPISFGKYSLEDT